MDEYSYDECNLDYYFEEEETQFYCLICEEDIKNESDILDHSSLYSHKFKMIEHAYPNIKEQYEELKDSFISFSLYQNKYLFCHFCNNSLVEGETEEKHLNGVKHKEQIYLYLMNQNINNNLENDLINGLENMCIVRK